MTTDDLARLVLPYDTPSTGQERSKLYSETSKMTAGLDVVEQLEKAVGRDWTTIRRARETTASQQHTLNQAFSTKVARDTSVVLFGSIARGEVTSGSDAD